MPRAEGREGPLRVAVVADSSGAAGEIAHALRDAGYGARSFALSLGSTYDRVRELRPAVVLVRASARSFALASAFARIAANGGPGLVLLTPAGSRQSLKIALDTGALVHLVEPVAPQGLRAAVRLAEARSDDLRELARRLAGVRASLQDRGVLDRAKAVLMRRLGLTEEEAHRTLQRESRNRNRKLIETAWHVLRADAELSGSSRPPAFRSA